jgi:chromosome partitioning protein
LSKIIAFANMKGGTGKTTSVINLAAHLLDRDRSVLMVDADPQAGLTISCNISVEGLEYSIYDCLYNDIPAQEVILKAAFGSHLLPSILDLSLAELNLTTGRGTPPARRDDDRFRLLTHLLSPLRDIYEYILVDTQPSFGFLTLNALTAADGVIIPVSCDYLSLRGLELVFRAVDIVNLTVKSSRHEALSHLVLWRKLSEFNRRFS